MDIKRYMVEGQMAPVSHYCHSVRAGDMIWVSGIVGMTADGYIPEDTTAQFDIALEAMDSPNVPNAESMLMVEALLRQFGEEAVALLAYRYLDKMTLKELGSLYGCSHQNIDKRLRRLHHSMQKYFAK